MSNPTCVYLVGAGPGDPDLLTRAGEALLKRADAVIYDYLVDQRLLNLAPCTARREYVGKKGYSKHVTQDQINQLLVDIAQTQGGCIVRLKGGDPFVFGRGGEEALALTEAGVPFKVVPAVTSGIAAPAYAGIPVTHRGISSSVTFVTGNEDPSKKDSSLDWKALASMASKGSTVCFYMGVKNLPRISGQLQDAGLSGSTPAAIVQQGTTLAQRSIVTTVAAMAADAQAAGIEAPAMTVVGQVASLAAVLSGREKLPLEGTRIAVTRSQSQASTVSAQLKALGARVVEVPVIRQEEAADPAFLARAASHAGDYDWIVFTSPNGVDYFFSELDRQNLDLRGLAACKLAAMGPGTAHALRKRGLIADLVPAAYRAESLAEALIAAGCKDGARVLIPRAKVAREELPAMLEEAEAEVAVVAAYQTVLPQDDDLDYLRALVRDRKVDAITVTSSSVAKHLVHAMGDEAAKLCDIDLFSIGPITSKTMAELGIPATAQASEYDIDGLVECILHHYKGKE